MNLSGLNEDELILIFKYCSEIDHMNIAKVCKLFENIIEEHFNEMKCRNLLMVSHVKNYPKIFERTLNDKMKYFERLRIHKNWTLGSCRQLIYFQHRENYETSLRMDNQYLYTASLGEFSVHQRRIDGIDMEPVFSAGLKNDSIITSLKRKDDLVAGSRCNGSIFVYTEEEGYNMEFVRGSHEPPIVDLDFHEDTFVTTTSCDTRFHRLCVELGMLTFDTVDMSLDIGFRSINFNPTGDKILATKAENFYLIDPLNGSILNTSANSSQIFQTQWISESSFLYTSWNSPLSLIDCRTDLKKRAFSCGNFTASSIDYDGNFGVLYGTLLGMVLLCDLRRPHTFERVFHLDTPAICRHLQVSESHLFVSTDNAIHLLNFN